MGQQERMGRLRRREQASRRAQSGDRLNGASTGSVAMLLPLLQLFFQFCLQVGYNLLACLLAFLLAIWLQFGCNLVVILVAIVLAMLASFRYEFQPNRAIVCPSTSVWAWLTYREVFE